MMKVQGYEQRCGWYNGCSVGGELFVVVVVE
jgi:uncharacterized protein YodC (DUF2158 family)